MKFTLVYQGGLPASGNKSKTKEVFDIREKLNPQLETLWNTHRALSALKEVGWQKHWNAPTTVLGGIPLTPAQEADKFPDKYTKLWGDIPVGTSHYTPLVRSSLHLACDLDILFLRQEDPGNLITQAGDIDGRIKTLLDALRMPDNQEQAAASVDGVRQYVVMESDSLVTSLKVETERLLFPATAFVNEVYLVIEVSLRVLQVTPQNTCLL